MSTKQARHKSEFVHWAFQSFNWEHNQIVRHLQRTAQIAGVVRATMAFLHATRTSITCWRLTTTSMGLNQNIQKATRCMEEPTTSNSRSMHSRSLWRRSEGATSHPRISELCIIMKSRPAKFRHDGKGCVETVQWLAPTIVECVSEHHCSCDNHSQDISSSHSNEASIQELFSSHCVASCNLFCSVLRSFFVDYSH